jgi:hypothetical protein
MWHVDVVTLLINKVMLSLCLTNKALHHEGVWGSGCIDPGFLDLGTWWRWVVSFTPQPLYPREKAPSTHWIGGWVGPRAGLDNVEKTKFLTLPGLELRPLGHPARSQSLYWLRYPSSYYSLIGVCNYTGALKRTLFLYLGKLSCLQHIGMWTLFSEM